MALQDLLGSCHSERSEAPRRLWDASLQPALGAAEGALSVRRLTLVSAEVNLSKSPSKNQARIKAGIPSFVEVKYSRICVYSSLDGKVSIDILMKDELELDD
ncbi:MAG: hypothetical protein KC418_20225 [Anaerolineales bacterium]|nr:hypothetical protein [Anaerolineales bacterium]MCB8953989.1 hypothetical protein [Ardenticatenales bacterium]